MYQLVTGLSIFQCIILIIQLSTTAVTSVSHFQVFLNKPFIPSTISSLSYLLVIPVAEWHH